MGKQLKKLQKIIYLYIGIYLITYIPIAIYLDNTNIKILKVTEWIIMILPPVILVVAIFNKLKKFPYICNKCSKEIYIKFRHMFTVHGGTTRILKCPHCKETTWAELKNE